MSYEMQTNLFRRDKIVYFGHVTRHTGQTYPSRATRKTLRRRKKTVIMAEEYQEVDKYCALARPSHIAMKRESFQETDSTVQ